MLVTESMGTGHPLREGTTRGARLLTLPRLPVDAHDILLHPPDLFDVTRALVSWLTETMGLAWKSHVAHRCLADVFKRCKEHDGLIGWY